MSYKGETIGGSSAALVAKRTPPFSKTSDYARYEAMKSAWIASNPAASSAQYESAMRLIMDQCEV